MEINEQIVRDFIHDFWYQFSFVYETHEEYCKFTAGLQGSSIPRGAALPVN